MSVIVLTTAKVCRSSGNVPALSQKMMVVSIKQSLLIPFQVEGPDHGNALHPLVKMALHLRQSLGTSPWIVCVDR